MLTASSRELCFGCPAAGPKNGASPTSTPVWRMRLFCNTCSWNPMVLNSLGPYSKRSKCK